MYSKNKGSATVLLVFIILGALVYMLYNQIKEYQQVSSDEIKELRAQKGLE